MDAGRPDGQVDQRVGDRSDGLREIAGADLLIASCGEQEARI